jgi:hypothetical protein
MSSKFSESAVIRAFAEEICQRLTRKIIDCLQKMKDAPHSGDGSGLENIWDEICVQIQSEQSILWNLYDSTVRQMVEAEVEKLSPHEREAIWLQTPEADRWEFDEESESKPYPVCYDDIVGYLVNKHIYHAACNWNNQRIREYLDHAVLSD